MEHQIASREEWLVARVELLKAEKEMTQQSDALAAQRQQLPWVRVDKDYLFDTVQGREGLADLFRGRSQLMIYHFMFGPDYSAGCPSCSMIADGFNGLQAHLASHDVMLWAVSRAPVTKLLAYRDRMGWSFPWASAADGSFNSDFQASLTPEQQAEGAHYNYRQEEPMAPPSSEMDSVWRLRGESSPVGQLAASTATDIPTYIRERPGVSAFVLRDGEIFHTYSAYARGLDALWGAYRWLDRAPLGRNEQGVWWKRHDEYEGVG